MLTFGVFLGKEGENTGLDFRYMKGRKRPEATKKISKANSDMMLFASDRCLRGGNAVVTSFSLANLRGFHTGAQNNDGP